MKRWLEEMAIMAQRKVGEDDVLENMAVANIQIYKRGYC